MQGIKYVSLGGGSGYAVAAKRYMLALSNSGVSITWNPMVVTPQGRLGFAPSEERHSDDVELDQFCNIKTEYDTVIVHMVPEYYPMWLEREPGKRIIGCTVWETDLIPKHWLPLLNSVDALIVPCNWNVDVFRQCGVNVPISAIPHVALETQIKKSVNIKGILPEDFVFYSINTWSVRKSAWLTIEAYLQAFDGNDAVCLVLKTTKEDLTVPERRWRKALFGQGRPASRDSINRIIAKYPNPAKILIIDEDLSEFEMSQLHQRGDCYLSLCRSEGWGLGAFDACAYGKPVIMTGHGGQTDFLPADNAFLIDYTLIPVQDRSSWASYSSDSHWADPDIQQAVKTMRYVFQNQQEARMRAERLQKYVCEQFSERRVADQFIKLLGQS